MKSIHFYFIFLCILVLSSSCLKTEAEPEVDLTPDNSGQLFFVMNRTGHNGPLSTNCGTRPEQVLISISTPSKTEEYLFNGDTQGWVTVDIKKGERLTVRVAEPNEGKVLVSKSKIYTPPECPIPIDREPTIRICPKDQIEFRFF